MDVVTGGCRKLNNEELHSLYFSTCIVILIKERMGGVGHVGSDGCTQHFGIEDGKAESTSMT
jgi:hypothetical protein